MPRKKAQKESRKRFRWIVPALAILAVYVGSFFVLSYLSNQKRWESYLTHTPRVIKYIVGARDEWEKDVRRRLGFRYADGEQRDRWAYYFYLPIYKTSQKLFPELPAYRRSAIFGGGPPEAQ